MGESGERVRGGRGGEVNAREKRQGVILSHTTFLRQNGVA